MTLELVDFQSKAREATMAFWGNREKARQKQIQAGKADQGERSGVTAGKNMDGFAALIVELIRANGLKTAEIHQDKSLITLPGFFRPTKLWDVLVLNRGRLVAAIELKSQVGPSFGNNFNNRSEEAIGTAQDLWTAYREGAFGNQERPFVGWLMMVEDAEKSRKPIRDNSPHFPVFPEFRCASYLSRYDVLCQRLIKEGLYSAASILASPRTAVKTGEFANMSELTGLKSFVTKLAAHVAGEAARQ